MEPHASQHAGSSRRIQIKPPKVKPARRRIGPVKNPDAWVWHDRRTAPAKLLRSVRDKLTEHLGGKATVPQQLLIQRIAWLVLHLTTLDARAIEDGGLSPHATREYLAWCNTCGERLSIWA